jgi:hypothetical protein
MTLEGVFAPWAVGALAATLVIAGCAGVSASTIRYANVPNYPPTEPAHVQILRSEPARPHLRLGEITVDGPAATAPAVERVEEKLRTEAASLGADAVVLVVDPLQPTGVASRSWWGGSAAAAAGRDVVAVAIKYR